MTVLVVGGIFREILDGDASPRPRMGGSGLTAAIIAARLGAETLLASYVGEEDADAVHAMLDTAGVDRSAVAVLPGASGTFVFPAENRDDPRPWPMYRPADAVPREIPALATAEMILAFGLPDFDPIAEGWLDRIAKDSTLIWDQQGWMSRARDSHAATRLAPHFKLYLANLDEARQEFQAELVDTTLRSLPPPGYDAAVVKRGPEGCTVITADDRQIESIPGFPLEVSSTIGSGDAFAGALAATLATDDLVASARAANAVAAAFLLTGGDPLDPALLDRRRDLEARSGRT
jgi:sugar/nucleoside kinase (ribokinase family)